MKHKVRVMLQVMIDVNVEGDSLLDALNTVESFGWKNFFTEEIEVLSGDMKATGVWENGYNIDILAKNLVNNSKK